MGALFLCLLACLDLDVSFFLSLAFLGVSLEGSFSALLSSVPLDFLEQLAGFSPSRAVSELAAFC